MSPVPHIGPTLGQRQAMRYAEIDKAAVLDRPHSHNAVLATEQAHEEARQLAESAFQPIPAQFVAGNDDDVTTEPEPVDTPALYAIDFLVAVAALALMAAFGVFGREPVRHLLVWVGVMS